MVSLHRVASLICWIGFIRRLCWLRCQHRRRHSRPRKMSAKTWARSCQFSPSPSGLAGSRAFANVECTSRSARVHVCPTPTYFEGRVVFDGGTSLRLAIPRLPKCTRLLEGGERERALAPQRLVRSLCRAQYLAQDKDVRQPLGESPFRKDHAHFFYYEGLETRLRLRVGRDAPISTKLSEEADFVA